MEEQVENPAIVHSPMVNGVQHFKSLRRAGTFAHDRRHHLPMGSAVPRSFRCETQTENAINRHNDRLTGGESSTGIHMKG